MLCDLSAADVHVPGAAVKFTPTRTPTMDNETDLSISAAKRKGLNPSQFGDPANRKYPLDTAPRVRNAAARLEQNKSGMSAEKYRQIRSRIARAAKKFGIESEYNEPKKTRTGGAGLRMTVSHPDGTRTEIHTRGMYSDKNDCLFLSLPLDLAEALSEGDDNKRVWIQVARSGSWNGHPQGPFRLDSQVFATMIQNFRTQGDQRIPVDFEHASELPANSGTIPMVGAPAQGWIYDLRINGSNLYGLVEWGDLARQYIEQKKYRGLSPAIRWKCKDRVTGAAIGPCLTSVALTNQPFIDNMMPLAASARPLFEEGEESEGTTIAGCHTAMCYEAGELLPRLRSVFRMSELATGREVLEHLDRLEQHVVDADDDMRHEGIDLRDYLHPLREMANPQADATWQDVIDIIRNLVDWGHGEHEEENDLPVTSSAQAASSMAQTPVEDGTDREMETVKELEAKLAAERTTVQTLTQNVQSLTDNVQTLTATVKANESTSEQLKKENDELKKWKAEREDKDIAARVADAVSTYSDKQPQLKDAEAVKKADGQPGWLTILCRNNPNEFERLYPPVQPANRHLLQNLSGDGRGQNGGPRSNADTPPVDEESMQTFASTRDLAHAFEKQGMSLPEAQVAADRIVRQANKRGVRK
jgi:hypothetical protein